MEVLKMMIPRGMCLSSRIEMNLHEKEESEFRCSSRIWKCEGVKV